MPPRQNKSYSYSNYSNRHLIVIWGFMYKLTEFEGRICSFLCLKQSKNEQTLSTAVFKLYQRYLQRVLQYLLKLAC